MKKDYIIALDVLMLCVLSCVSMISCLSTEDIIFEDEDCFINQYEYYQKDAKEKIANVYLFLNGPISRSEENISARDLVNLLTSLPVEIVDSLYNIYCTPEIEEEYAKRYDEAIDVLTKRGSKEQVQQLF